MSGLNENQERRLQVVLFVLERGLDDMAAMLGEDLPRGEMYVVERELGPAERRFLLDRIAEMRLAVSALKQRFGLAPRVTSAERVLAAMLGSLWVRLHDARPRNLSGFGAVDPSLFDTLEPELVRMIGIVEEMKSRVEPPD
jgi:hypothetical protein